MISQAAIILALMVEAKSIEVEVISMQANDADTSAGKYTEQSYIDKSNQLAAIAEEIQQIARSGVFS